MFWIYCMRNVAYNTMHASDALSDAGLSFVAAKTTPVAGRALRTTPPDGRTMHTSVSVPRAVYCARIRSFGRMHASKVKTGQISCTDRDYIYIIINKIYKRYWWIFNIFVFVKMHSWGRRMVWWYVMVTRCFLVHACKCGWTLDACITLFLSLNPDSVSNTETPFPRSYCKRRQDVRGLFQFGSRHGCAN